MKNIKNSKTTSLFTTFYLTSINSSIMKDMSLDWLYMCLPCIWPIVYERLLSSDRYIYGRLHVTCAVNSDRYMEDFIHFFVYSNSQLHVTFV